MYALQRLFGDYIFVVDTRLPRFEALAYVFLHFDALIHLVILVSSAFIFQTRGGRRRGLGPRNDVLTTCKAVTQRGGQRVICVFPTVNILIEAKSEPAEEMIKI